MYRSLSEITRRLRSIFFHTLINISIAVAEKDVASRCCCFCHGCGHLWTTLRLASCKPCYIHTSTILINVMSLYVHCDTTPTRSLLVIFQLLLQPSSSLPQPSATVIIANERSRMAHHCSLRQLQWGMGCFIFPTIYLALPFSVTELPPLATVRNITCKAIVTGITSSSKLLSCFWEYIGHPVLEADLLGT